MASQKRLMVPKLVTGLKQWHLRNTKEPHFFYPKANFNSVVASIPDGADVGFIKSFNIFSDMFLL